MQARHNIAERKDQGYARPASLDANTNKVGILLFAQASCEAEEND